jgi:hypothetical protein
MDEIPETQRSLRRHIGHHLEEIALAALPPEIYHMDDGTGDGGATGGDVENTDRNTEVIASSNDSEGGDPLLLSDLAESTTADTLTNAIQLTERDFSAKPAVRHRAIPNPGKRHYVTPAGAGARLRCTFVENGQLCTAETFNLPSKMRHVSSPSYCTPSMPQANIQ